MSLESKLLTRNHPWQVSPGSTIYGINGGSAVRLLTLNTEELSCPNFLVQIESQQTHTVRIDGPLSVVKRTTNHAVYGSRQYHSDPRGQGFLHPENPYRDGTIRVAFDRLDFLIRLTALVLKPGINATVTIASSPKATYGAAKSPEQGVAMATCFHKWLINKVKKIVVIISSQHRITD